MKKSFSKSSGEVTEDAATPAEVRFPVIIEMVVKWC